MNPQEGTYRIKPGYEHLFTHAHGAYAYHIIDLDVNGLAFITPLGTTMGVMARLCGWTHAEFLYEVEEVGEPAA